MLLPSIAYRLTPLATAFALLLALLPVPSASLASLTLTPNMASGSIASTISHNWAGYRAAGGLFTSVTGTWTVPQISNNGIAAADATWVGIGGITSSDLIQGGTEDLISRSGQVVHAAIFEMLPNPPQPIPVVVQSGDSITVAITERAVNQWQVSFLDKTNGQSYNFTTRYRSSFSSAEWIEEAPARGGRILPLNNFGTVVFSGGSTLENQHPVTIGQSSAQPITMVNSKDQILAAPSSLSSAGTGFSVVR